LESQQTSAVNVYAICTAWSFIYYYFSYRRLVAVARGKKGSEVPKTFAEVEKNLWGRFDQASKSICNVYLPAYEG
jgi:hypothetical protein